MPKNVVFRYAGRLGNAIFRYIACATLALKNNLEFVLEEDYKSHDIAALTFYPGLDIPRHDLGHINGDLKDKIKSCLENPEAMGFNTLGFIKSYFEKGKIHPSDYINSSNEHGLYIKNTLTVTDTNYTRLLKMDLSDFNLLVDGYFQFNYEYDPEVFKYMDEHANEHYLTGHYTGKYQMKDILTDMELPDKYDIVIHIRLDDMKGRPDYIEFTYYEQLFNQLDFDGKRTCIVVGAINSPEDREFIDQCMDWFSKNGVPVKLESNDVLTDFNLMKQCTTLVCSMSTLAWTAAILSRKLKTCYMPNYNISRERPFLTFKGPSANALGEPVNIKYFTVSSSFKQLKAYTITLQEYPDRLDKIAKVKRELLQIGLELRPFYGVYGKNIKIQDTEELNMKKLHYNGNILSYDKSVRITGAPMSAGELGLMWSNYYLWNKLLKDPDTDGYLILEDDAEWTGSFDEYFANLPKEFDVITLSRSDFYPFEVAEYINEYYFRPHKRYFNRTTGIIISKNGARKLVDYVNDRGMNEPVDDVYCSSFRCGRIDYFASKVPLVFEGVNNVSIISKIDHQ